MLTQSLRDGNSDAEFCYRWNYPRWLLLEGVQSEVGLNPAGTMGSLPSALLYGMQFYGDEPDGAGGVFLEVGTC